MTKNMGKRFEEDFASSVDDSCCFLHRLKDSAQSYNNSEKTKFSWDNPCDFFVYNGELRYLFAFELKSTCKKSMNFQTSKDDDSSKMIKFHQIESLEKMSKYNGIIAGFLFNFRDEKNKCQRTYFQEIKDFNIMIKTINKKSFDEINLLQNNAIKINGEKKRTRFRWKLDEFFKNIRQ